ncbi:MAG: Hsp20/alpha crystallin family protein [Bacteroidetes bacterium]|nr:Hsp20/alpha crystallin family protein [Bacteroidota bacterium]
MTTRQKNRRVRKAEKLIAKKSVNSNVLKKIPALNIDKTTQEYIVSVAVPGMERNNFTVQINNRQLIISAEKIKSHHLDNSADKSLVNKWQETISLPLDADTLMTAAVYRNGELKIYIPRRDENASCIPADVYIY